MNPEEVLVTEIAEKLALHRYWWSFDFVFLQVLIWSSILASTTSALLIAVGASPKWLTALLAVIPALALTVESNFNFSARYKFHAEYIVELENLNRRLQVVKEDPKVIATDLAAIQRALESKFPAPSMIRTHAPAQSVSAIRNP